MSAREAGRLLTVPQFAALLGRSERFAYELVERQEVGHYRQGRSIHIPEDDARAYLARTYVPAKPGETAA